MACDKSADAFRTIGEAAAELGLKTHVLRFWETKFDNLRPMKRPDGRRFYRPDDMELLRKLQNLLHVQGLTIRGAVKALDGDFGSQPGAAAEVGDEGAEEMMVPAEPAPPCASFRTQSATLLSVATSARARSRKQPGARASGVPAVRPHQPQIPPRRSPRGGLSRLQPRKTVVFRRNTVVAPG